MIPHQQRVVNSFVEFVSAKPGLFRNRVPIDDIIARYKEAVGILAVDLADGQTLKVHFPIYSVMGEYVYCYMIWDGSDWNAEIVAGRTDANDLTGSHLLVANLPPGISQCGVSPLAGGWTPPPPVSPDRDIPREKTMPSPEERDAPHPLPPEGLGAEMKRKEAIEKLMAARREREKAAAPIAPGLDPKVIEAHASIADDWIRAVARTVHSAIRLGRVVEFNHSTDADTGDITVSVNIKGK